jgi:pimeloyl-ACP methyl ester carboxylesterase
MQRPVMNPMFLEADAESASPAKRRRRFFSPIGLIGRIMLADVCFWRSARQLQIEDASPLARIFRGLLYRLLFVPVVLACVVIALVYLGTHPPRVTSMLDPLSQGTYYDPISFVSEDGLRLDGWLVPLLDAKIVLQRREQSLRIKSPAVILVHDYGTNRAQMLPLVQPLHDAGYIVFVISLRGSGGMTAAGSTFGLRERADVQGAIDVLRRRPGVDANRIAVLGLGTGANAALLAAEHDPKVAALILDHAVVHVDQMISDRISPPQPWLQWLRPICKWTFEIAYRVDTEDLDIQRRSAGLASCPVLMFDSSAIPSQCFRPSGMQEIKDFLGKHLTATIENSAAIEVKEMK